MVEHFGHGSDPIPIGMGPEAVVERGPLQTVAMRDLDRVHLGPVERAGDRLHLFDGVLVADCVHAVAQGNVLDVELGRGRVEDHAPSPCAAMRCAIFSAVLSAAEVMMSRLPA